MTRTIISFAVAAAITLFLIATLQSEEEEVNLYTSRHYDTDLALYDGFTASTGIKVNIIEAAAEPLIERIKSEGEFSPADVFITVDAGRLWRAEQAGILDAIKSPLLEERIPPSLRHPEGLWYGLSTRARVIIYNKATAKPEPLSTYHDLADPAHKGKVCMRSSSNIYNTSLMASIISHKGANSAEEWAKGVVDNFARKPQSNDTGQIRAVASGECAISIINTYYLARLIASENAEDKALANAIGLVFPNQDTTGTHVNVSGAGLVTGSRNRENAIKFLEYLTEDAAQAYFANGNNEYPVVEGVASAAAVTSLGPFKQDLLSTAELGRNQSEAVRVFDRAGWQ